MSIEMYAATYGTCNKILYITVSLVCRVQMKQFFSYNRCSIDPANLL